MDAFEKLAKLAGASVESVGDGLPRTRAEAKALGVTRYFTGRPCLRGHVAARAVLNSTCYECHRQNALRRNATPEAREYSRQRKAKPEYKERNRQYSRQYRAKPGHKERQRQYDATPERKERNRQYALQARGDEILFAVNQAFWAATNGKATVDIVFQCPEPQRSQLQALVNRIKADPGAGKAVVGLLRTMRELRKAELAELRGEP